MKFNSNPGLLKKYSHDRSIYEIKPSYVAFPKKERDLIDILEFSRKNKLPITPRGGGTGLSGAAIGKGVIVDFSKYLTKIKKIGDITRVQSGILLKKLIPRIEKAGYMLPSVPLHGDCAIGGNVNTRSIGPKTLKYGTIDNQIKSVRGILADRRILDTSKKIPKDIEEKILRIQRLLKKDKKLIQYLKKRPFVAGGYNLKALLKYKKINDIITHLIVSSTGTLILLTEVELKLPKYKELKDLYLIHFKDFDSLQKALDKLLKLKPVTLEYADKETLDLWDVIYHEKDALAVMIVGFEHSQSIKKINALKIKKILPKNRKRLWKSRELTLVKLEQRAKRIHLQLPSGIDDTSFDPKNFSKIIKDVKEYAEKKKINIASFGHIGVGSLHLRPFLNMKKNPKSLDIISRDIFKIVKKYGGTLVGEHNSGLCRSRYLKMESKRMYQYMKKIKDVFDPENILNPKVIFNLAPITKNIKV